MVTANAPLLNPRNTAASGNRQQEDPTIAEPMPSRPAFFPLIPLALTNWADSPILRFLFVFPSMFTSPLYFQIQNGSALMLPD